MAGQDGSGFGARLKTLREAAGLSQADLAGRAGMHRFGVAKIEQGLREPGWLTVLALARALGVSVAAFEAAPDVLPPKPQAPRLALLEGREVSEEDLAALFECLAGRKPDRGEKARARAVLAARDGEKAKPAARPRRPRGKGK
jgi:transcriptional regulator with XRE-family HTH domain